MGRIACRQTQVISSSTPTRTHFKILSTIRRLRLDPLSQLRSVQSGTFRAGWLVANLHVAHHVWTPRILQTTLDALHTKGRSILGDLWLEEGISTTVRRHDFQISAPLGNVTFQTNDKPKSKYICARHGVAGMGSLTDHGTQKWHGWQPRDYPITHNVGRGGAFYQFRNVIMNNVDIPIATTPTLPFYF